MIQGKKKYAEDIYGKWNNGVGRMFGEMTPKERLLLVASNAFSAFCAFVFMLADIPLFGKALGAPLCDAYVCASGRFAVGAFAGAIYGAYVGSAPPSEYIILVSLLLIRFIASRFTESQRSNFLSLEESFWMRLSSCAALCLLRVTVELIQMGLARESFFPLLLTLTVTPAICSVMLIYFTGCPNVMPRRAVYYLSMSALFSAVVYCASGIYFIGADLGTIAAVFLTLCVSYCGGAVWGCVIGALLGFFVSAELALSVAVMGILSGLLFSAGVASSVGISVAAGAAVTVFFKGLYAGFDFIPNAVLAAAVTAPVLKYGFLPSSFPFPNTHATQSSRVTKSCSEYGALESGSKRLLSLSKALAEVSDIPRHGGLEARTAEHLRNGLCESCPMSPICWDGEYENTFYALCSLSGLYLSGTDNIKEIIPARLSERCVKLKELCAETERLTSEELAKSRMTHFGGELKQVSEMLSTVASELSESAVTDNKTEAQILRALTGIGVTAKGISVLGDTRKRVFIYGLSRFKDDEDTKKLRQAVSKACSEDMAGPIFEDGRAVFVPNTRLEAESSFACETKEGERCSGDRVMTFSAEDGSYYSVIADGMGSGEEAAECAEYASAVLEKLLRSGMSGSVAVRMLGGLMQKRLDQSECFSAVDIMKTDLYSGQTEFVKSGAADSYILRSGAVYTVNSRTVPVGITSELFPEGSCFELRDGDTVVMVSDGLCPDGEGIDWIKNELMSGDIKTAEALASGIMEKAVKMLGKRDDMTVCVTKIRRAS